MHLWQAGLVFFLGDLQKDSVSGIWGIICVRHPAGVRPKPEKP